MLQNTMELTKWFAEWLTFAMKPFTIVHQRRNLSVEHKCMRQPDDIHHCIPFDSSHTHDSTRCCKWLLNEGTIKHTKCPSHCVDPIEWMQLIDCIVWCFVVILVSTQWQPFERETLNKIKIYCSSAVIIAIVGHRGDGFKIVSFFSYSLLHPFRNGHAHWAMHISCAKWHSAARIGVVACLYQIDTTRRRILLLQFSSLSSSVLSQSVLLSSMANSMAFHSIEIETLYRPFHITSLFSVHRVVNTCATLYSVCRCCLSSATRIPKVK